MLRVAEDARLKYCGQILRGHLVQVGLARKHSQKIENIQQQLSVQRREFRDERLVGRDRRSLIKVSDAWTLCIQRPNSLRLVISDRVSKAVVEIQRYYRFGKLVEVSSKNIRRVVDSIPGPVQAFAIPLRRVKGDFELLDALLTAGEAENALYVRGYQDR